MTGFQPGVSEPLYALEVAYCRGPRWRRRNLVASRRYFVIRCRLVAAGAALMLLPVQLRA